MTRPRAAEEKPALRAADIAEVRLHHLHPRERAAFRRTITARALARYEARRAEITFTNAVLEGSTFTLPEVRTLLDGLTPEGKKTTEVLEVMLLLVSSGVGLWLLGAEPLAVCCGEGGVGACAAFEFADPGRVGVQVVGGLGGG